MSAHDNFLTKKRKLLDAIMQENIFYYPSLMGFETFLVYNSEVVFNALKTGNRHLDFAKKNYSNLSMIKTALKKAFRSVQDSGLGLSRECLWLTMKVAKLNNTIDHVVNLLNAVSTGYFDLLLYHYPLKIFDTKNDAENSCRIFCETDTYIGVSNFYVPYLKILLKICDLKGLRSKTIC